MFDKKTAVDLSGRKRWIDTLRNLWYGLYEIFLAVRILQTYFVPVNSGREISFKLILNNTYRKTSKRLFLVSFFDEKRRCSNGN